MKKLFLTLLLISPLAKSEVLELTCESAFPFWVSLDLSKSSGVVTYPENNNELDKRGEVKTTQHLRRAGEYEIKKFDMQGDFYVFRLGGPLKEPGRHNTYINRKNLKFLVFVYDAQYAREGKCKKGIHELPEYQI